MPVNVNITFLWEQDSSQKIITRIKFTFTFQYLCYYDLRNNF